jgi:hypothetical protein
MHQFELLMTTLKAADIQFMTVKDYYKNPQGNAVILRHDIDDRKANALKFAELQNKLGIRGTYYFRIVPQSFDATIISEIESMGHEIGYHYEDMDLAHGNMDDAYQLFLSNLATLRSVANIETICMHGSPRSDFDNKSVWSKYDYKKCHVICEPYLDLDFQTLYYITDTGRMWDGNRYSIRDYITTDKKWPVFHSTRDIIRSIEEGKFPYPVMINFHPQRWTNHPIEWTAEFITQRIKNILKAYRKRKLSAN